jgi:hypothetical protein
MPAACQSGEAVPASSKSKGEASIFLMWSRRVGIPDSFQKRARQASVYFRRSRDGFATLKRPPPPPSSAQSRPSRCGRSRPRPSRHVPPFLTPVWESGNQRKLFSQRGNHRNRGAISDQNRSPSSGWVTFSDQNRRPSPGWATLLDQNRRPSPGWATLLDQNPRPSSGWATLLDQNCRPSSGWVTLLDKNCRPSSGWITFSDQNRAPHPQT